MVHEKNRILLVDDEENCLRALQDVFELEHIECATANNAAKAIDIITHNDIDIVISDVRMPGLSGMDLLKQIKRIKPEIYVLMLTGHGSIHDAVQSIKQGAYQYILKPVIMDDLLAQIKELLQKIDERAAEAPLQKLKTSLPAGKVIVGQSMRLQNVAKLINKIANTDLPVLILGESGTGKELAATALHYSSDRSAKSFVAINCAAFPDTLLESELFGYEKGAFTDARTSKAGKIEEADGGTLFLDEIGDMKPAMQAKLLRVLEEQQFQRLGSNKYYKIDIRIISATNRDLRQAIEDGLFRADLYYRLNAVSIVMPTLREIPEDIPLLSNYFAREFAAKFNRKIEGVSAEALQALAKYHWPGNVRELANAIRRSVALAEGKQIQIFDLPPYIANAQYETPAAKVGKPQKLLLSDVEKEHILAVIDMVHGNKSEAAQILGIHRDTLLRKLKKFDK
ncbi:MAG TPA: sigma-54 dependent transcriptional regulator [bacterium]|nr:sigma-54 dependent transcriptional regulator [bacterium]HPN32933.1 sigma-54 dependent transcriptional regulator [bacterium]